MRTCVFLVPGLSGRLLDTLDADRTPGWFSGLLSAGRTVVRPTLPAVTMPVQATYTTGTTPAEHGIVANGLAAYRDESLREHLDLTSHAEYRTKVSCWEQSNGLLKSERIWRKSGRRTAMLFVQSSMGGAADVVVTPKPTHTPDGKTLANGWSDPADLYPALREQLGEFPLHHYWGPMTSIAGTEWIAACGRIVWDTEPCDLQWVYVPHLDYDLQKLGPNDPKVTEELSQVLAVLTPLAEKVLADGGRVLVLGEYGIVPVSRSAAPNAALAEAGLLVTDDNGEVDYQASRAFALCDHQVAHVYTRDDEAKGEAKRILSALDEVGEIHEGDGRAAVGLDTDRAGDLVVFSKLDAWFEYRWWSDWSKAPQFAWTVDIHAKPGYDPTEMFFDPPNRRICADRPELVKGSHGAMPDDEADWPVLVGTKLGEGRVDAAEVASAI